VRRYCQATTIADRTFFSKKTTHFYQISLEAEATLLFSTSGAKHRLPDKFKFKMQVVFYVLHLRIVNPQRQNPSP